MDVFESSPALEQSLIYFVFFIKFLHKGLLFSD